jgi:hypothetical protein
MLINQASVEAIQRLRNERWRVGERWGTCWIARDTRRTFSGVGTVRGRPEGCLFTLDAVVLNCVTQFSIVWGVGNFPFYPMSKCRRKTRIVSVTEQLFKIKTTANARCSTDLLCMTNESFKIFYTTMCVSLRHLHRSRHGAKIKSSNWFSPTLLPK